MAPYIGTEMTHLHPFDGLVAPSSAFEDEEVVVSLLQFRGC